MRKFNNNEQGRSMIEMLGVLAIVGVLSVAGIAGYSKAMAKYKINKVMDEVSTIAANVKTMFAANGVYTDLATSKVAYELALLPEEMTKGCASADSVTDTTGTCVVNGLGGSTIVKTTATTGDDAGAAFYVIMNGLTKEGCVALVTSDWGGTGGVKYIKGSNAAQTSLPLTASGTKGTNFITPTTSSADAFAYSVTADICNCTGSTCSVGWVFF